MGNGHSQKSRVGGCQSGSLCHILSVIAPQIPPVTAAELQFTGTEHINQPWKKSRAHILPHASITSSHQITE